MGVDPADSVTEPAAGLTADPTPTDVGDPCSSPQGEHGAEAVIDRPHRLGTDTADEAAESRHVDRTKLFHQHPGGHPSISITGRIEAGRALTDVGATSTTDLGRSTSDWTTTPKRRPACSWLTALGIRSSKMSPLCSEALHHRCDLDHLRPVDLVRLEPAHLFSQELSPPQVQSRFEQCMSNRRGARESRRLQGAQRSLGIFIESNGDGGPHSSNVSHYV